MAKILKLFLAIYIYLIIILYNYNITAIILFKKKDIYNILLIKNE